MSTVEDIRLKAKTILEPSLEKYIAGDANPQTHANTQAFHNYLIRPYVARDTKHLRTSTTILGHHVSLPICIAPMARQHQINEKAECIPATAAKECGVGFTMSSFPSITMEDLVTNSSTGLKFLNIYFYTERSWVEHVVKKAEQNGFHGFLVGFTNMPMSASTRLRFPNLEGVIAASRRVDPTCADYPMGDTAATWADVMWLKSITKLPVIIKGILSGRDAISAVKAGADAVLVSNFGGRQLSGVPAPIDVLPEVVAAVGGACEVYMDGSVRCGADLFKALALGARATFVGRPILWGMAYGGVDGVRKVLDIYKDELKLTMRLAGVSDVNRIPRDVIVRKDLVARL